MSSDYSEVSLDNRRDLPPDINKALGRLSTALASTTKRHEEDTAEENERNRSPLHEWCQTPLVESSADDKSFDDLSHHSRRFPIHEVFEEIVKALHTTDVVCLIAPTGSGKSILAPYIAERLASKRRSGGGDRYGKPTACSGYRKTLMVVPNVEHCNSTARTFGKLFRDSGIRVAAYANPYEELVCGRKSKNKSPEFVITTRSSAIRVLPDGAKMELIIVDEVHEHNDNVQETISMTLKMLLASPFGSNESDCAPERTLNKLLLMTATLDGQQRKRYEEYFTNAGLSFKILDFTDHEKVQIRHKELSMSCLGRDVRVLPEMFESTTMSAQITSVFDNRGFTVFPLNINNNEISERMPSNDEIYQMMRSSLNEAMKEAWANLQERIREKRGNYDMQSILVILPGLEQVETLYSACFNMHHFYHEKIAGFHPLRLASNVRDDEAITSECTIPGKWQPGGHLGRIVLATNVVCGGLTVPNVAYVIDSGVLKVPTGYTRNGLRCLKLAWIDEQMIIQRAGRTGRTTDGEYFLPYSSLKVEEMMNSSHGGLINNRHFGESHFLHKKRYELELLHEPSEELQKELLISMKIRGGYSEAKGISPDVLRMHDLFNFLSPEHARIVIQGTQMGIAAHVILLVADSISRIKFCRTGWKNANQHYGPSDGRTAIYLYAKNMDEKHGNHMDPNLIPQKYKGVGDSIALADLLASFYSVVPGKTKKSEIEGCQADHCNFWGGDHHGSDHNLASLYASFVREEGRDAVHRYASQIVRALRAAGLMPKSMFDRSVNRHIVSGKNFCQDENGRALLSALLTMHSSRVGKLVNGEMRNKFSPAVYEIHRKRSDKIEKEFLSPEAGYTQPDEKSRDEKYYGRFTEMFERKRKYSGLIDPITLKQIAFFLNLNSDDRHTIINPSGGSISMQLNASTGKRGIKISLDQPTCSDARNARFALKKALSQLTHTRDKDFIADLEEFIIKLWRECEKTKRDQLRQPAFSSYHYDRYTENLERSRLIEKDSGYGNGRPRRGRGGFRGLRGFHGSPIRDTRCRSSSDSRSPRREGSPIDYWNSGSIDQGDEWLTRGEWTVAERGRPRGALARNYSTRSDGRRGFGGGSIAERRATSREDRARERREESRDDIYMRGSSLHLTVELAKDSEAFDDDRRSERGRDASQPRQENRSGGGFNSETRRVISPPPYTPCDRRDAGGWEGTRSEKEGATIRLG